MFLLRWRKGRPLLLTWMMWLAACCYAQVSLLAPPPLWVLAQAKLASAQGEQLVALPHQLSAQELPAQTIISPSGAGSAGEAISQPGGRVRYTLQLDLPAAPSTALAVYIPKLSLAASLQVNGQPAGQCAWAPLEAARCLHKPQLFVPPTNVWRAGTNTLSLELYGNNRQPSGLSRVTVGDAYALRQLQQTRAFWQVELLHVLTMALLTTSLLALGAAVGASMSWPRRRTLLLLAAAGIVNALCDLNMLIDVPPVGFELYSWFTFVARLESMPLYLLTLLSFYNRLPRWVMWLALGFMLLMPVLVAASGNSVVVVRWLYLPLGLSITGAAAYTFWLAWHTRRIHHALMAGVSSLLLLAGWWDFAKVQGALAFERIYLLPYAYPATLLVMGYMLMRWLNQALAAQRALSHSLEHQLAEREAALHLAQAQRREAEHRRIRDEERVALLSHVHDGLGSQLVSARMALQYGQLDASGAAEVLSQCSDDLRLVLSTLEQQQTSLAHSAADLRHRLQSRLVRSPLALDWQMQLDGLPPMKAHDALQLLRILQEALSNAIRHAEASQLHVLLRWLPSVATDGHSSPGWLEMLVQDDGKGFDSHATTARSPASTSGLGMQTLRQRARALGAVLHLDSGPTGTCLSLRWQPPAYAYAVPALPEASSCAT